MLDVAIIGAGAAGLGAARAAKARGFSFRVLEAASFTGGRARTDKTRLGVPFDVGCRSLYGGEDNPFYVFARDMESELEPVAENIAFFDGGRFLDTRETQAAIVDFERLESDLIGAHTSFVETAGVADRSQAEVIDSSCIAADYFRQAIHIEFTAAAEVISLADPMHRVLATSGEAVIDGYGALIQRVCADIPVDTNCPVSAIELSGRDVVLDTPKGRVAARTVIVTASTAVLAAERIALRPNGWPNRKLAAIDSLPMVPGGCWPGRMAPLATSTATASPSEGWR